jgi:hypothetical protein
LAFIEKRRTKPSLYFLLGVVTSIICAVIRALTQLSIIAIRASVAR